jgi:hypothetical protein
MEEALDVQEVPFGMLAGLPACLGIGDSERACRAEGQPSSMGRIMARVAAGCAGMVDGAGGQGPVPVPVPMPVRCGASQCDASASKAK